VVNPLIEVNGLDVDVMGADEGPLICDHVPVPTVGVFAVMVVLPTVEQSVWSLPAAAAVGAVTTATVGVVLSMALQLDGGTPVTRMLKVVLAVKFPVGNGIEPPVPATADPINALFALLRNWYENPDCEPPTLTLVAVPPQTEAASVVTVNDVVGFELTVTPMVSARVDSQVTPPILMAFMLKVAFAESAPDVKAMAPPVPSTDEPVVDAPLYNW
jgi:hypothetical protein